MHPIPEILEDLRAGRMIVLVDDEHRENEGDLVCAAELTTPEVVNFMLREARGLLCLAMTAADCDRLELTPQTAVNTTQRGTAFTVTIDAHERFGVTTGVSASDRSTTIRLACEPSTRPGDLSRPGHVNPLRARDGGVLVRAGQTEGSVDLCRLAGLRPAAAIIEIMNDDGTMARQGDLRQFCHRHNLKMCSVADVIQWRLAREKLIERIDEAPFRSELGEFRLIAYRSLVDPLPHIALCCGEVGTRSMIAQPVLVRVHSQNVLGDVFADESDSSGRVLRAAMKMIHQQRQGAIVYLRHEGMGQGLLKRLQTLHRGVDTPPPDPHAQIRQGAYGIGAQIIRDLGIRQLRLITNHPFRPTGVEAFDLSIAEYVSVPAD